MAAYLIENARLLDPGHSLRPGAVLIRGGCIEAVRLQPTLSAARRPAPGGGERPTSPWAPPAGEAGGEGEGRVTVVDARAGLLTPGLIDVHTHGVCCYGYETGAEALVHGGRELGRFGVTTVVPTIVPRVDVAGLQAVAAVAAGIPQVRGLRVPGLHLEGPFVALGGAACLTVPGDLGLLAELLAAAGGRTRIMSVSPETPNILPVIERLVQAGIRPFITHTQATVEQTLAAIDAGATHATHFYDVFPLPPETDPGVRPAGVVETMLADRRTTVDFIADGVHVHPMAIRAALAAKGWQGITLITDSNIGAGLPPGLHDTPWGYAVRVRAGDGARHADQGFLAGSALTMNRGVANLLAWLDLPAEHVWAMATLNPAKLLGLSDQGRLEVGADADLVLWDDDLNPVRTWVGGECVYERA